MWKAKELKKRCGAKRESLRPFWKSAPVRAALVSETSDLKDLKDLKQHHTREGSSCSHLTPP